MDDSRIWWTYRAQTIDACERAAEFSGMPVIAQMPRMAEFYRKRTNEQLRAARAAGDATSLADAKAKLKFLDWVEGWCRGPYETWPPERAEHLGRDHIDRMNDHLSAIGYSLRYLIRAYSDHPKFRPEWAPTD